MLSDLQQKIIQMRRDIEHNTKKHLSNNPGGVQAFASQPSDPHWNAGIAAALINEHTYVATDSAGAFWQIRNSILYPQRVKRHRHAKHLETIVHHTQLYKDAIHLYKVKAHAGILGNECADAIAKCSVENQSGHDIRINTNAQTQSSVFWPARWITLVQLA